MFLSQRVAFLVLTWKTVRAFLLEPGDPLPAPLLLRDLGWAHIEYYNEYYCHCYRPEHRLQYLGL